jgi:hypothetical protein
MNTPAERIDFFVRWKISVVEKVRNSEDNVPHVLINTSYLALNLASLFFPF